MWVSVQDVTEFLRTPLCLLFPAKPSVSVWLSWITSFSHFNWEFDRVTKTRRISIIRYRLEESLFLNCELKLQWESGSGSYGAEQFLCEILGMSHRYCFSSVLQKSFMILTSADKSVIFSFFFSCLRLSICWFRCNAEMQVECGNCFLKASKK